MTKVIEVIVSPSGESRVETKGFSGTSCQQASRFLEAALGARLTDQCTAEFYSEDAQRQTLSEGGAA